MPDMTKWPKDAIDAYDKERQRAHDFWKRLEQAEAERDERTEQFRRAARIANELTLETQTPEEWTADLVRQVRQARAERDELKASLLRLRSEFADLAQSHDKMEAERDAAVKSLADHGDALDRVTRERDEARAEVARLQDLHTRCAAFDDQPGPSCVRLAADAARLRLALLKCLGALEVATTPLPEDRTEVIGAMSCARAALSGTEKKP